MKYSWIFLCAVCIWSPVQGTYRPSAQCQCNGKALYCAADSVGLRCVKCQGNTEGRHCESCRDGFYHQRAGESCVPCNCNPTGSEGQQCDSQGRCSCKQGVQGDRCDRCPNGASVSVNGCEPLSLSCRSRSNGHLTNSQEECLPCFCYGHSSDCSSAKGYSVHNISSTFDHGPEGWRAATAQGVTPSQVQFRWSPTHLDLEVISQDILPGYLFAPASYLGNQELSYGQTLSFSLRLDRGVRRPSTADVVLEGAGLRVTASLGDLRTVVACSKKITYTFRLDEQAGSRWRPQLSPLQFQTLLSNLTAIMIRATFGENGRGYLDNVSLVSARLGSGAPAGWVEKCSCPTGYEGQYCERCAQGYKKRFPENGPFSPCDPCSCRGGNCDPETGDCYSADETPGQSCPSGYYSDPAQPRSCLRCPCPHGNTCAIIPGTPRVRCNRCPPGTTGSRCHKCDDGFYGDALGERGAQRLCQRCQCNGHTDPNAVGNCDRVTGECLKCLNHTRGFYCERCAVGFHHSEPTQACKACACNPLGSAPDTCSDKGQCVCKEGFEGTKCERSTCPACFGPVKSKMERYSGKLREIESLFRGMESGSVPVNDAQMEKAIRVAEEMVADMQRSTGTLSESEKGLLARLSDISGSQLREDRDMKAISKTVDNIQLQDQEYQKQVSDIQRLINDVRRKLQEAKLDIKQAEFPSGDAEAGTDTLSGLVRKATDLADKHQGKAETVEKTANSALSEAEKTLVLMRSVITGENKIRELVNDLKSKYEADSARVRAMEKQATRLNAAAGEESRVAADTLKQISDLELNLPKPLKKDMDGVVSRLDGLKESVERNLTGYRELQEDMQTDQREAEDLLKEGKKAQQVHDQLLARANAAKAETDSALKDISSNIAGVEEALQKLRGFDDQISDNKARADEAIGKLPGINATIQQAIGSNTETQSVLDSVGGHYSDAMNAISALGEAVPRLQGISTALPPTTDLLRDATKLRGDLQGLKTQADSTMDKLTEEADKAERQKNRAGEASVAATGAYNNAKNTKDAVGETLKTVNDLLNLVGSPDTVDEKKVADLEKAISDARNQVNQHLRPRLRELEANEAQQRATISGMLADIDTILADITNLEEIRKTIPKECYNSPPIERP